MVVTLLVAGFVPSPMYRQYAYAATPFMLLGVVRCLSSVQDLAQRITLQQVLAGCLLVTFGFGVVEYDGITRLPFIHRWIPVQVHETGVALASHIKSGQVLTLEPIYPLEGGEPIYKEFATGRFGVRAAEYLTESQEDQLKMPDSQDIDEMFSAKRPPTAVLIVGTNETLDQEFIRDVQTHGYKPVTLSSSITLWLWQEHPSG
jgi:hypothetical protein